MKKQNIYLILFVVSLVLNIQIFAKETTHQTSIDTNTAEKNEYIVTLRIGDDQPSEEQPYQPTSPKPTKEQRIQKAAQVRSQTKTVLSKLNIAPTGIFDYVLFGFSAQLNDSEVQSILRDPLVKDAAPVTTAGKPAQVQNQPLLPWSLDRIDQRYLPLNDHFFYGNDGTGTHIFILDSGVRITHNEFTGRIGSLQNFGISGTDQNGDPAIKALDVDDLLTPSGHGTGVASVAAGTTFGVAKGATVHPVRVFNSTGGPNPRLALSGLNWITDQLVNGLVPNAITNMSILFDFSGMGFPPSDILLFEDGVVDAINAGVIVIAAAGNEGETSQFDACLYSPARIPEVITVGAIQGNDEMAYFSNSGQCVDVYAPGFNISTAGSSSDIDAPGDSGTSFSAPLVSGVAALYVQDNPNANQADIQNLIIGDATQNVITNLTPNSANLLLHWFKFDYWKLINGNSGSGRIYWWNINANDKYTVGDFTGDGKDDLLAVNPNGWHHTMKYVNNSWQWIEGNGSGLINSWAVSSNDRYVSGDFDGDGRDELLALNPNNLSHHTMRFNGTSWLRLEGTGNGFIGSWFLNPNDRYLVGDFNIDGKDELLIINPVSGQHQTLAFSRMTWQTIQSGSGGQFGSWTLNAADKYVVGDFNGDGPDDLLAIGSLTGKNQTVRFVNSGWQTYQTDLNNGLLGNWQVNTTDKYTAGDFNSDGKDELLTVNAGNGNSSTLQFSGNIYQELASNSGGGRMSHWLFNGNDFYLSGNFNGGNKDLLMGINPNGWWQVMQY